MANNGLTSFEAGSGTGLNRFTASQQQVLAEIPAVLTGGCGTGLARTSLAQQPVRGGEERAIAIAAAEALSG